MIEYVISTLKSRRFSMHDEKALQAEIYQALLLNIDIADVQKEYRLDKNNIIDFFLYSEIGIEAKLKGQKRAIYKQCERYCKFEEIKKLLLVTNQSMGFPQQINGKDCYILNIGKAWL